VAGSASRAPQLDGKHHSITGQQLPRATASANGLFRAAVPTKGRRHRRPPPPPSRTPNGATCPRRRKTRQSGRQPIRTETSSARSRRPRCPEHEPPTRPASPVPLLHLGSTVRRVHQQVAEERRASFARAHRTQARAECDRKRGAGCAGFGRAREGPKHEPSSRRNRESVGLQWAALVAVRGAHGDMTGPRRSPPKRHRPSEPQRGRFIPQPRRENVRIPTHRPVPRTRPAAPSRAASPSGPRPGRRWRPDATSNRNRMKRSE